MSPESKPVTFSENVTVIGMVANFVGLVTLEVMAAVGLVVSNVIENDVALLALLSTSKAAPAAILAVTVPWAVGVMVAVKVLASVVAKPPSVPLLTVMSLASKPVMFSVNVIVIGMLVCFVGLVTADVMATPGMPLVKVIENGVAAALALPAVSVAAPAATLTVTAPLAVGVTIAV